MRDNKIEKLPDDIAYLQGLIRLDLSNNSINRYMNIFSSVKNYKKFTFLLFEYIAYQIHYRHLLILSVFNWMVIQSDQFDEILFKVEQQEF